MSAPRLPALERNDGGQGLLAGLRRELSVTLKFSLTSGVLLGIIILVKKILAVFLTFIFAAVFVAVSVSAVSPNQNASDKAVDNANIPEVSGDYAIRGRQDLRVRVFVHEPGAGNHRAPKPEENLVCEDNDSEAVVGHAGWRLSNSDIKYKINQSSAPSSVRSSVPTFVAESFTKWQNSITSDPKPNLVPDGTTSISRSRFDGQNIIAWGRTNRNTLGVTYIWYYTATGIVAEVDTIMNSRISWSLGCSTSSYDAENIMIHELGHWFGLDDHYTAIYTENTMFGYGSKAEIKKVTLEDGDKSGINLIY